MIEDLTERLPEDADQEEILSIVADCLGGGDVVGEGEAVEGMHVEGEEAVAEAAPEEEFIEEEELYVEEEEVHEDAMDDLISGDARDADEDHNKYEDGN